MGLAEPKGDIEGREGVARMVESFYDKVYKDEVLRPMFVDVAGVDLEDHLPVMNRFWNAVLFGETNYRGNPMEVHRVLDTKKPLNECHFIRWLSLFRMTVDELFVGPSAERAKAAAAKISSNFEWNLERLRAYEKERLSI